MLIALWGMPTAQCSFLQGVWQEPSCRTFAKSKCIVILICLSVTIRNVEMHVMTLNFLLLIVRLTNFPVQVQGVVPEDSIMTSASKQCTLSTFGLRKNVRSLSGRWLREPSPEFVAFGPRCHECGARFKTVQALASHRRCIHYADWRGRRSSDVELAAVETPHWAWHFLQGSQGPMQVIDGDEATPCPLI